MCWKKHLVGTVCPGTSRLFHISEISSEKMGLLLAHLFFFFLMQHLSILRTKQSLCYGEALKHRRPVL